MGGSPPRQALHGKVTSPVLSATSVRKIIIFSALSHEAYFATVAQDRSGRSTQAPAELTFQYAYRFALARTSNFSRVETSTSLTDPAKDGFISSGNTPPICSNWSVLFRLVLKIAPEIVSLITSP